MRWTVKTGLVIICLAVLAAFGGATYQAIGTLVDEHRSPEPGVLVDIGGYRLKIFCVGAGSPTVVLESGLGDISVEWQPVQSVIAHFARICAYDRAGYGGSDAGPMPRTSATIAKELHTVLQRAGEKPPFVLVGHSFGGYNVRVFNGKYSNEVAGLVLVDSVQEDEYKLLPPAWKQFSADLLNHYERQARTAPLLINLGIARLMLQSRGGLHPNDYLILQAKYLRARASELKNIQTSAEQARAAGLHSVPHAGETTGPQTVWDSLTLLQAERIGHGTSSAQDPALLRHLAETGVPLEVCPSSNIATRAVARLEEHPILT